MFYKYDMLSLLLLFIDIQNCDNVHCTCYEEAGSEIYFRTCSVLWKTSSHFWLNFPIYHRDFKINHTSISSVTHQKIYVVNVDATLAV